MGLISMGLRGGIMGLMRMGLRWVNNGDDEDGAEKAEGGE